MPLQNRVDPSGTFHAVYARGTMMGNRGGQLHSPVLRKMTGRLWATQKWIICLTVFKGRQRTVMGNGYTELFFLDEVTALAAGHRPCFECRNQSAKAFQTAWQRAEKLNMPPKVGLMDPVLHRQRLQGGKKRIHKVAKSALTEGAMIVHEGAFMALKQDRLLRWDFTGYTLTELIRDDLPQSCCLLTPPATLAVLREGYLPHWHLSALSLA